MKKGVSPIVATVLLIVVTIAMAMLIYVWASGFIREQIQKFGTNADKICDQLSYDVGLTKSSGNLYDLDIINSGNTPIYAVDIKKFGKSISKADRRTISIAEGESKTESLNLEIRDYTKIMVIPVILGTVKGKSNARPYACDEKLYGKQRDIPLA